VPTLSSRSVIRRNLDGQKPFEFASAVTRRNLAKPSEQVFKTGAFNRSATPPKSLNLLEFLPFLQSQIRERL
jgi:hypothetical protein